MKRKITVVAVVLGFFALLTAASSGTWKRAGNVQINGNLTTDGTLTQTGAATLASTLAVTGATTLTGALTTSGGITNTGALSSTTTVTAGTLFLQGVTAAVTAAGSDKTDCTALTKEYNVVTTAASPLMGVCLLTAAVGTHQKIVNETAVAVVVYPLNAGDDTLQVDNFAALTADVGWVVGAGGGSLDCVAYTTTLWKCETRQGVSSTVAAAGDTISDSTAFGSVTMGCEVNVTGADGTKGVTLPTGGSSTTYAPGCISIYPSTITAALDVFPNNSDNDTINGGSADAVFIQTARTRTKYCSADGVAWIVN